MFIHRPDVAATEEELRTGQIVKDAADLIIAKHRNGELGRVKLRFRGDQVRYVNPPPGFLPEDPMEGRESRDDEMETISDEDLAEVRRASDDMDMSEDLPFDEE